jgi:hypothetical protein
MQIEKVTCGDCRYFVRDGRCGYLDSIAAKQPHPFEHAPFWVWSDCYSDREQVRRDVTSCCPTFELRAALKVKEPGDAE